MVELDKEAKKRYIDSLNKPYNPPRPAPKPSSLKKKGRKSKEEGEEGTTE